MNLDLDKLLADVPEEFRPVVAQYGPALIAMTTAEFWAWIEMLLAGDTRAAYESIVSRLDNTDLMEAWGTVTAKWTDANERNSAQIRLQKEAVTAVLRVLLAVALAGVGL